MGLFRAKFACISAISNPVFRWDSCKGSEWDSVKKCLRVCKKNRDSRLDLAGDSRLQAARSCTRARHARSWSIMLARALQDKIGQLAVQLSCGWNSRLSQAASQPCFEKPNLSHSILTLVYIPLIPMKERELSERILREKS